MASPIRVVLRLSLGEAWRDGAEDRKSKGWQRWLEIRKAWKDDPGIRFCSYYMAPGADLDGYSHHWVFEVDDLAKVEEINHPIAFGEIFPFDKYSITVAFGNKEEDAFWAS